MKEIGIVGLGYVGKSMRQYFEKKYHVLGYDVADTDRHQEFRRSFVRNYDIGVVCVPTPMKPDGSCDTSIVEEVVGWLENKIILIKSTVPPGTVDRLKEKTGKNIVFSPEYCGEGDYDPGHNWQSTVANEPFFIFGGDKKDTSELVDVFTRISGPSKTYFQCTAKEAELIKYMENTTLGCKVVLSYEFHQLAKTFGADWNVVREGWLLDPRIGRSHTAVFHDQTTPYGGKCLPKDINAIVQAALAAGYTPEFLQEIIRSNTRLGEIRSPQETP